MSMMSSHYRQRLADHHHRARFDGYKPLLVVVLTIAATAALSRLAWVWGS